ncbi:MAG: hypothetical protein IJ881_06865, partial [Neisseriaceae bacterium]|nr:hypothetical protein [Neisseriaceae bacterium]
KAFDFAKNKQSRFAKLRKGFLPSLLPDDFEQRIQFIEDFQQINLPPDMRPFQTGYKLANGIIAIELAGHAMGHFGILTENVFLIADAAWQIENITEKREPHLLSSLAMDNYAQFRQTLKNLQILSQHNQDLLIIPTHCEKTLYKLWTNK